MDEAVTAASCYNFQISQFVVACVDVSVCACQRTKGWCVSPCVSCCAQVCVRACTFAVARVSPGPAHISVAQTGAADGHAETCSALHRDIFGLLCYWEAGCWRNFLFKTKWFFFFPGLVSWTVTFYSWRINIKPRGYDPTPAGKQIRWVNILLKRKRRLDLDVKPTQPPYLGTK